MGDKFKSSADIFGEVYSFTIVPGSSTLNSYMGATCSLALTIMLVAFTFTKVNAMIDKKMDLTYVR